MRQPCLALWGSIPACAGETRWAGAHPVAPRVYPRVCGGNLLQIGIVALVKGLSPRVRGKLRPAYPAVAAQGSIPACAGETRILRAGLRRGWVYPRVCGGNHQQRHRRGHASGLSPRVRGKRRDPTPEIIDRRSIPACAGETLDAAADVSLVEVYPRVCGGNGELPNNSRATGGLSPRVRGKHYYFQLWQPTKRSIPACAGETVGDDGLSACAEVYPRVCGGNFVWGHIPSGFGGLSPRVRGKPASTPAAGVPPGSIPACAGETRQGNLDESHFVVYPRVCGGNGDVWTKALNAEGLSPRVRGKPGDMYLPRDVWGSIPACAGETHNLLDKQFCDAVYPRVCGGNRGLLRLRLRLPGLSPRVRGKPMSRQLTAGMLGSIPACAGETRRHARRHCQPKVYPRVCGGNNSESRSDIAARGLSPRVRGKPAPRWTNQRP